MSGATRNTLIVGLGVTGLSCARFLARSEAVRAGSETLRVVDSRAQPPGLEALRRELPEVPVAVGTRRIEAEPGDRVVVSPGVALDDPLLAGLPAGATLVSDIDLFCEAARAPIIAVTGTNGKSTVTSLAGHLLRGAGRNAVVGGNLGEAALDLLDERAEIYVLELSSFQLERMRAQHFRAATLLNVSEDHLDRHGSLAAYLAAKQRIYLDCELAVANRDQPDTLPPAGCPVTTFGADPPEDGHWGIRVQGGERWLALGQECLVRSSALPLAGIHNELNVLAAAALAAACGAPAGGLGDSVATFSGLPHRCRRIARVAGVDYIDDSKATNVGATQAALEGLGRTLPEGGRRIVLIAGGDGKGAAFEALADAVSRFVKGLVLLGRDAPGLAAALRGAAEIHRVADMDQAVSLAATLAGPGDLVLLSPACASLDMYESYSARGEHFARAVEGLAA